MSDIQQVSVKRAAELLGRSESYVLDLCYDGLLDSRVIVRPGRKRGARLISLSSLRRLVHGANVHGENVVELRRAHEH